jgi:hypothetical protein
MIVSKPAGKPKSTVTRGDWEVARRDLLKGLGVGLAFLPWMPKRTYAQVAAFPKRLITVLLTEGYRPGMVAPATGPLAGVALPPVTSPLEKYKDDLIIMANLNNPQFRGCEKWAHGAYGTIFAQDRGDPNTGNGKEYWEPEKATFDQVIAKDVVAKVAPNLTVPSLALAVRVGTNSGGTGSNRCFWSGAKQPITPEADPYKLFAMLFSGKPAGMAGDPAGDKVRAERKSLLDFVGGSLEKYSNNLGTEDRTVVKGHLDSIRTLEKELTAPRPSAGACNVMLTGDAAKPLDIASNNNNGPLLNVGFQLMVAALKCDVTRVATMQFGDATGGSVTFPGAGVGRNWHSLGHNPAAEKIVVDKWCMTQFAGLLEMLKMNSEGTGTMLDHMTVLWANHMESGDTHGATRLPWILAGKGGGYWKTGQSLANPMKNNTHVMATIINAMGGNVASFGDGVPMPELLA